MYINTSTRAFVAACEEGTILRNRLHPGSWLVRDEQTRLHGVAAGYHPVWMLRLGVIRSRSLSRGKTFKIGKADKTAASRILEHGRLPQWLEGRLDSCRFSHYGAYPIMQ